MNLSESESNLDRLENFELLWILEHIDSPKIKSKALFLEKRMNSTAKKYFLEEQIAEHHLEDDIWVTIFGRILDLSELVRTNKIFQELCTRLELNMI